MSYTRVNWENSPSTATPISAENLNTMDSGIKTLDTSVGTLSDLDTTDKTSIVNAVNEVKQELESLGSGVSTTVRSAIYTLFANAAYSTTGLDDELAIIESWAEEITAITLNQTSISISGSGTYQLVATTIPSGGTVTWVSSDTSIATVNSTGLVTSVNNGTATITASCGDLSATCTVTISGFATLTGITATYTQSGTVYDTESLSDLVADLVVVANYDDSSTVTLTSSQYTLSGTLAEGTSTITVTYGGFTDTFSVTVTAATTTLSLTWTNSGATCTSQVFDARTQDVYFTFPYVEGYSGYASGATADSDFIHIAAILRNTEDGEVAGYYYIDTQEIETSSRTDVNKPSMPTDTITLIAPHGYYVSLYVAKRTTGFSSNANFATFMTTYANTVDLVAV